MKMRLLLLSILLARKVPWLRFLACLAIWCGSALVAFAQAPPNDEFANATILVGDVVTFSGTLSNATSEGYEPDDCSGDGGTVWWSWTATQQTAAVVEVLQNSPTYSTSFAVFKGTEICALTLLDYNYIDPITNRYVGFLAMAGATYYIRVRGDAQSFTLRLTATNAPLILAQPQSTTIPAGSSAWFGVVAGGLVPPQHSCIPGTWWVPYMQYQWRFEGTNLAGQTGAILLVETPPANRAGAYSVVVSSASGVTTSAVANLTISPTDPRPTFAAMGTTDTNRFSFVLKGVPGRRYIIEGSTNLVDWSGEPEFYSCCESNPGVVLLTNASSVFSITRNSSQRFLRASPLVNPEICIAHLKAINFTLNLAAIQTRNPIYANATEMENIRPFMANEPICPSGGTTFFDSYVISIFGLPPTCANAWKSHFIP